MSTTIMRNSRIGDDWIREMVRLNPVAPVLKDGKPTGNYLTGPVRLDFANLFAPKKNVQDPNRPAKFGATLLFPPGVNFGPLVEGYNAVLAEQFREYRDAATGQYPGLHNPFRAQAERAAKYEGFTSGSDMYFLNCTSNYKPPVVDRNMNPIVDPDKVHSGVWAICSINPYGFGKNPPQPKKGVTFGLQTVMFLEADTNLGGGAPDPKTQFAGVNIRPPTTVPGALFGQPAAAMPGPAGIYQGQPATMAQMPQAAPDDASQFI